MATNNPLVSIIIPVYNGGEILRRAFDAILSQTYEHWEAICLNDGSTDAGLSAAILDAYAERDARFRVYHMENKGPDSAQAFGLQQATGAYVVRCDQDDVMHPQHLEYCVSAACSYDLDFLSFRYTPFKRLPPQPETLDVPAAISSLKVWCADSKTTDVPGYQKSLRTIHTDTWSHFVRLNLAREAPLGPKYEFTRVFWQIRHASRWAASRTSLYFYEQWNFSSMAHSIPRLSYFTGKRVDLINLYKLYEDERRRGDPLGEWKTVSEGYAAMRVKHLYGRIRRCRKGLDKSTYYELRKELAFIAYEVFDRMQVDVGALKLRIRIVLLWIAWRFRREIAAYRKGYL